MNNIGMLSKREELSGGVNTVKLRYETPSRKDSIRPIKCRTQRSSATAPD